MKKIIIFTGVLALGVAGYFIGTSSSDGSSVQREEVAGVTTSGESGEDQVERNPDLIVRGRVMSISDEQIIVGTYERQQAGSADRAQLQNATEQEREAFRQERQLEGGGVAEEPEITGEKIISLTADTEFYKGGESGRGRGAAGAQATPSEREQIDIGEIIEGATVTVELREGSTEAKSISLQTQQ